MPKAKVAKIPLHFIFRRIHILTFGFAVSIGLVSYIESSFLQERVGEKAVGSIFTLSYLVAIVGLLSLSVFVRKFGKRKTFVVAYHLLWVSLVILSLRVP